MGLLIVGTGSLACLFAARLAGSGNQVTMMGNWPDGLAALRQDGVTLHELDGGVHNYTVNVVDGSTCKGSYNQALVLVKSWQTQVAAGQLKNCLSDDGIALTLQNGFGNLEILEAALTPDRVALGVTTVGARLVEPGQVQFTGDGKVFIGEHLKLGGLRQVLQSAGFQVEIVTDPTSLLWGKLVINAAINPLTALLRVANGELLTRPAVRELLHEAAREAARVATIQGIVLPYPDPILMVEGVAKGTASNYSSMLQDVMRGAATEIDSINGAIVRIGERIGVPTPVNRTLWQLVSSLDHH